MKPVKNLVYGYKLDIIVNSSAEYNEAIEDKQRYECNYKAMFHNLFGFAAISNPFMEQRKPAFKMLGLPVYALEVVEFNGLVSFIYVREQDLELAMNFVAAQGNM